VVFLPRARQRDVRRLRHNLLNVRARVNLA
jgi:hypothetical protein